MPKEEFLSERLFNEIKQECPHFLTSYYTLCKFYEHMTNDFTHKVWKDGRIVLTPNSKTDEKIES